MTSSLSEDDLHYLFMYRRASSDAAGSMKGAQAQGVLGAPVPLGKCRALRTKQVARQGCITVHAISAPARPQQPKGGKSLKGEWTTSIPIVGETFEFLDDHFAFIHKRVKKYGPVFKAHVYGMPVVVLTDFAARDITAEGAHKTVAQFFPPTFLELTGGSKDGSGIVRMSFQKESHQKMRRQIGAALSGDAVASYLPTVESLVRSHLAGWQQSGEFDLEAKMRELTMSFSNDIVVGLGLDQEQKAEVTRYFGDFTKNLYSLPINLPGSPYRKAKEARTKLLAAIRPSVEKAISDLKAGKFDHLRRKSTMQNFMATSAAEGDELDAKDVSDVTLSLLLAGYDTTAWSYLVLLVLLPQLPARIVQRLREEQQQVVAQHGESLSPAALSASKYADAVAREALRIKGPVPVSLKQALTDLNIHDTHIPAGSVLLMSTLYSRAADPKVASQQVVGGVLPAHMDIYDLEESFQPERWLTPATTPTSDGQFGAGAHFCLGWPLYMAEAKALLAIYARHYSLSLVQEGPVRWVGDKIATQDKVTARLQPYSSP